MTQAIKIRSHARASKEIDSLKGRAILRIRDLVTFTGTNRMQVHRWEQEEDFPKAIRLSARTKGWWRHEIEDWLEGRKVA